MYEGGVVVVVVDLVVGRYFLRITLLLPAGGASVAGVVASVVAAVVAAVVVVCFLQKCFL